ncbi:MAG: J domain-containing protein [Chitinophaga sp.]|uniref:J domain-containing protein n=1 Tax=Chitinophaga sp. TaxID=1869181 RepID=UPI0025B9CF91|nr:DnaJ domain-containing protein [Chitinophaga sp.]MBV8256158.1 J domain-containing protein [Chitinophaga sp.]
MNNYYQILDVSQQATQDEIKAAYRRLSKKYHPDLNGGDKYLEEKFKELQQAYEVLSNPSRRIIHDAYLRNAARQQAPDSTSSYTYEEWEKWETHDSSSQFSYRYTNGNDTTKESSSSAGKYIRLIVIGIIVLVHVSRMNNTPTWKSEDVKVYYSGDSIPGFRHIDNGSGNGMYVSDSLPGLMDGMSIKSTQEVQDTSYKNIDRHLKVK